MNNDKRNNKFALFILMMLWIIILIGILAYNPYNKNSKATKKQAMDGKTHYLYREVILYN